MRKVPVTDELLDAYVNRPLAARIVNAVKETSITPNQLTLVSASLGTLAGALFTVRAPYASVAGALSLFLCMVFDCSDGQLARLRGGGSIIGRIWDGYADYLVAVTLHVGLLITINQRGAVLFGHVFSGFERFLLVALAGASIALNSGRFDFYKQRYLAHTGSSKEPESPEVVCRAADQSESWLEKAALRLFACYVRLQQGADFHRQAEEARVTAADPRKVEQFVAENGTLVRLWSLSGPTLHNAVLCVAAMFAQVVPQAFTYYCVFGIVVVNAYCLVLALLQRRVLQPRAV